MSKPGRIESGVVQFGSDWPGLFLRGDVSFQFGNLLRKLLDTVSLIRPKPPDIIFPAHVLRGLQSDLLSVEVGKGAPVQQLKFYEECIRPVPQDEIKIDIYLCQYCEREPDGRHKAKCPLSAESMLKEIRALIDAVPSPEGRIATAWVVAAASTFEKIRDLRGWTKE